MRQQKTLETYEEVKEKALRLLEFRSHSEKELKDKLSRCGASGENIERTLDFCRRYGFVNDAEYAKAKARDLLNLKKLGLRRICGELKNKGISDELISEAIYELDLDSMEDTLNKLVRNKLRDDFSDKNINKCIRYFLYRGYDLRDIRSCINDIVYGGLSD